MTQTQFFKDMADTRNPGQAYAMAYGYLKAWLELECRLTNNGQISRAEVLAKIAYVDAAIQTALELQHPGVGN